MSKQKPSLLDDLDKERIKFNIEIIKLLTLLFITTGGGSLALLAEALAGLSRWVLVLWGMVISLLCGVMGIIVYKNTLKKVK